MNKPILKPKTVQEWIDILPPEHRDFVMEKARESYSQTIEGAESFSDLGADSLSFALKGAFPWYEFTGKMTKIIRKYGNKAPIKFYQFN